MNVYFYRCLKRTCWNTYWTILHMNCKHDARLCCNTGNTCENSLVCFFYFVCVFKLKGNTAGNNTRYARWLVCPLFLVKRATCDQAEQQKTCREMSLFFLRRLNRLVNQWRVWDYFVQDTGQEQWIFFKVSLSCNRVISCCFQAWKWQEQ